MRKRVIPGRGINKKNRRKRVAILADFPWKFLDHGATGRGGGQHSTWLAQLAEEFANNCPYEIHWVTLNNTWFGLGSRNRKWGGQDFHLLGGPKVSIDVRLGFRLSRSLLLRELRRIEADLVHCWGTEAAYPIVIGEYDAPSILSMQGILTEYARIGCLPETYFWRKMVELEARYLDLATVVSCESQWGIDRVKEVNHSLRTYQVEYGVNHSFFELEWQPDIANPYALFSGAIESRKGVDTLIDAISLIGDRRWRLKLAGHGPLYDELKARGLPGVEWLGVLPWSELKRELVGAACLVHPTRADTSPNVVKEARVVGLPVITTVHGGQAGYISDGENGIIVEPLGEERLAEALSRIMGDPHLARRMGAARHAEDRAYFRPAETARGFLEIYDELLTYAEATPVDGRDSC